jgi:hypothetical protein
VAGLEVVEPLKGHRKMGVRIPKNLAVKAYAVARQAERSIDFALASQRQWDLLRDYYHDERLHLVQEVFQCLRELGASPSCDGAPAIARDKLAGVGVLWALCFPVRLWLNRLRVNWRFSPSELAFLSGTLSTLAQALPAVEKPDAKDLVELRMNLSACQRIIRKHLAGLPELDKADNVEHFCQAVHVPAVSMREIWGEAPVIAA